MRRSGSNHQVHLLHPHPASRSRSNSGFDVEPRQAASKRMWLCGCGCRRRIRIFSISPEEGWDGIDTIDGVEAIWVRLCRYGSPSMRCQHWVKAIGYHLESDAVGTLPIPGIASRPSTRVGSKDPIC